MKRPTFHRLSQFLWVLLLSAQVFGPALAKCAAVHYVLSGRVSQASTGTPIAGAKVSVLVDGSDAPPCLPSDQRPLGAVSIASGEFMVEFYADTLRSYSSCTGHNCSRRPHEIRLVIEAPGYHVGTVSLDVASLAERDLEVDVSVPESQTRLAAASGT